MDHCDGLKQQVCVDFTLETWISFLMWMCLEQIWAQALMLNPIHLVPTLRTHASNMYTNILDATLDPSPV